MIFKYYYILILSFAFYPSHLHGRAIVEEHIAFYQVNAIPTSTSVYEKFQRLIEIPVPEKQKEIELKLIKYSLIYLENLKINTLPSQLWKR